jgi:hypothetical protein
MSSMRQDTTEPGAVGSTETSVSGCSHHPSTLFPARLLITILDNISANHTIGNFAVPSRVAADDSASPATLESMRSNTIGAPNSVPTAVFRSEERTTSSDTDKDCTERACKRLRLSCEDLYALTPPRSGLEDRSVAESTAISYINSRNTAEGVDTANLRMRPLCSTYKPRKHSQKSFVAGKVNPFLLLFILAIVSDIASAGLSHPSERSTG